MYAYTLTALALLTSLAAAQIPGLPDCAAKCVGDSFGSCGALDVKCICSNTELLSGLSCCISKACTKEDQDKTLQFANSLCAGEGVNTLPTAATCAPGQGGSASSTAAAASGSSSAADASGSGSVTSSASGEQSSGTSSEETTQLSGSSAAASSTDSAASATESSSATSSGPAESTGGADVLALRLGSAGLGVVVAGVMAAL